MYIKLNDRQFIVPTHVMPNVEKLVQQVVRKRDRLLDKKQITEDDFLPFKADFSKITNEKIEELNISDKEKEELKGKTQSHAFLEIQGDVPNINRWSILGTIEPVLGQTDKYTLHSYTNKDLPKQYRDLEEPTKCEHCDTNRKRNQTFVIKNRETDEVLQVGSSCMKDFIDSKQLTMLMTYSSIFKEIENTAKENNITNDPVVSLINKEEFIATLLAVEEKMVSPRDSVTFGKPNYKKIAEATLQYFNYLEYPEHWESRLQSSEKILFDKIEVTDEHLDEAEEVVDFFEEFDPEQFSDNIFNIKELVGNDFDFLSTSECMKIAEAPYLKTIISNREPDMLNYMANYHSGVMIGGVVNILPNSFNKEDYLAALVAIGEKDTTYRGNSLGDDFSPSEPDKAIFMISESHFEKHKQKIAKFYSPEKADTFEEYIGSYEITDEHYKTAQDIVQFFKDHSDIKGQTSYQQKMIDLITDDNEKVSENDAKVMGFSYRFYKTKSEALDLKKQIEEKESKGMMRFIGAQKDRFEEIELKYVSRKAVDSDFGLFYVHNMKDVYGNTFAATSQMKNPFGGEDENQIGKWIQISGTIKGHRKDYFMAGNQKIEVKQTQLNRIKPLTELYETPKTDGEPVIKGKYTIGELKVNEYNKEGDIHCYKLSDKDENEYTFLTTQKLNVEKDSKIEAGFMLSGNKQDIYKIEKESIKSIMKFSENDFTELTAKQLEKKIKENKIKRTEKENKQVNKLN